MLIAGNGGVDGAGPVIDAAGERLDMIESLVAKPEGDVEGAYAVVAEDDDGGVGVKLLVGARGNFAHWHQDTAGQAGGLNFPGLADVEQDRRIRLAALLGKDFGRDLRG